MEKDDKKVNNITGRDIDRLNYLYKKQNSQAGLTYEEQEEQGLLRQKCVNFINNNIKY